MFICQWMYFNFVLRIIVSSSETLIIYNFGRKNVIYRLHGKTIKEIATTWAGHKNYNLIFILYRLLDGDFSIGIKNGIHFYEGHKYQGNIYIFFLSRRIRKKGSIGSKLYMPGNENHFLLPEYDLKSFFCQIFISLFEHFLCLIYFVFEFIYYCFFKIIWLLFAHQMNIYTLNICNSGIRISRDPGRVPANSGGFVSHLLISTISYSHLLSHHLIFTPCRFHLPLPPSHFKSAHLHIFPYSHLHTFSSSYLLFFTSAPLHTCCSSHLSSSHLRIITPALTPCHLLIFFLSLTFFIFSL